VAAVVSSVAWRESPKSSSFAVTPESLDPAGLAAALQTIDPRAAHQRCWVHKLRNLLGAVRRRDHAAMKADAQAIYQAAGRTEAVAQAQAFAHRWREAYPQLVTRLLRDLPELLAFFQCPRARYGASSGRPM